MRFTSIISAVSVVLLWSLTGALSFFTFIAACGVGLAASAGSGTIGQQPAPWIVAVLLFAGGSALILYLSLYWRARSAVRVQWIVAATLGVLIAPIIAAFTCIQAILLTSATWGRLAESEYEKSLIVEAGVRTWGWWFLLLFFGFIAMSVFLGQGPKVTNRDGSGRRFAWYVYAALSTVPLSSVGALATTTMFAASPG